MHLQLPMHATKHILAFLVDDGMPEAPLMKAMLCVSGYHVFPDTAPHDYRKDVQSFIYNFLCLFYFCSEI